LRYRTTSTAPARITQGRGLEATVKILSLME
jgi:hypothetical protein